MINNMEIYAAYYEKQKKHLSYAEDVKNIKKVMEGKAYTVKNVETLVMPILSEEFKKEVEASKYSPNKKVKWMIQEYECAVKAKAREDKKAKKANTRKEKASTNQIKSINLSKRAYLSLWVNDGNNTYGDFAIKAGTEKLMAYGFVAWFLKNRNILINTTALHHTNRKVYDNSLSMYTNTYNKGSRYDNIRNDIINNMIKEDWIGEPSCTERGFNIKLYKKHILEILKDVKLINGKPKLPVSKMREIQEGLSLTIVEDGLPNYVIVNFEDINFNK